MLDAVVAMGLFLAIQPQSTGILRSLETHPATGSENLVPAVFSKRKTVKQTFERVADLSDLPEGGLLGVEVDGR
ncbi:MAG: hypothetical protein HRU01_16390, partial [Myxococcales bacterium]|nr:hypothetical protein [Myxococcales bacterium]